MPVEFRPFEGDFAAEVIGAPPDLRAADPGLGAQ
jgi:hypothetical protein